jgi:hypothetical protein
MVQGCKNAIDHLARTNKEVFDTLEAFKAVIHEVYLKQSERDLNDPLANNVGEHLGDSTHVFNFLFDMNGSPARVYVSERLFKSYYRQLVSVYHPRGAEPASETLHAIRAAYRSKNLPALYNLWLKRRSGKPDPEITAKCLSHTRGQIARLSNTIFHVPMAMVNLGLAERAHKQAADILIKIVKARTQILLEIDAPQKEPHA